ncbi:glutamine amidotransferase family protein [Microbaculum marinum]|uniref:Glutamine amidotransferase family protein n=1 Tax=Microbaculum marinum TaxID=1764581 RepID=A0AAW9RRC6_9HYPH
MCGIVGLFLKDPALQPELGAMTTAMLATMCDRGPDSAGFAVYGAGSPGHVKLTLRGTSGTDFHALAGRLGAVATGDVRVEVRDTHAVLSVPEGDLDAVRTALAQTHPEVHVVSYGKRVEIYKEVGRPDRVAERFGLSSMSGTHAIGHTRMATESAVTTDGAHPFSTGADQCLVHNGSLSNHNLLRRSLQREGIAFETENDTEVAAGYLTLRLRKGARLGEALEGALADLDGFYTFVVGTEGGFGVLRDPIACKPAVMAETDSYVAFGSEFRVLATLPGIAAARVWEPEPARPYFWEHA